MFYPIQGGQKIIVGEGFPCWVPPIPDKTQIINYELPREEQFWRRQLPPPNFKDRFLEEEYKRSQELELLVNGQIKEITHVDPVLERFRRREWLRRLYGVWFFNDGEPTFITGSHYFYLNYCQWDHKINDGYPMYYEFSRDNFYIRTWCTQNPKSLGYLMIASRGTGKTNEEIATVINRATYFHKHRAAFQGKHIDDSVKTMIQAKAVPLFNALPSYFKPQYSHGTNAKTSLVFSRPSVSGKAATNVEFGPNQELGSIILAVQPGEKVLDRESMNDVLCTEVGKTEKTVADVFERHGVNARTVYRNHRKIGMLREESTVEELDAGGEECLKIYKASDMNNLDGNGWTTSKIHRHFISALTTNTDINDYVDMTGKNWGAPCDKFGRVDRKIAGIIIQNDLDAVKHDLREMSSRMRKSPRTETEAFIKDQSKSIFNIQLLTNRLNKLRHEMVKLPYVTGGLYWLKDKFGPVGFKADDHTGRFNFSWFPDEHQNVSNPDQWKILNNVGKEWGYDKQGRSRTMLFPKNDNLFRIGTDPIKFTKTKDPRASKAAIHAFRLFDGLVDYGKPESQWLSHNFFCEYLVRPEDPETYLEDLAMLCIFLGARVLPERNVPSVNMYFEQNGLDRFLAYPKEFVQSVGLDVQTNSDDAGYASSPEVIDYYTRRWISFINRHIDRMPFDRTIESLMNFDSTNPTKEDATVSGGFTLVHAEKISNGEDQPPEGKIGDWFDMGDNSGVSGRLLSEEEMEFSQ